MYVVLGASGNTGSVVARRLLERGERARAIGRDASKLSALARLGADVDPVNLNDTVSLTTAFTGAKGAYVLIPPQIHAEDFISAADVISTSIADAVKDSGVSHVVALSSIGAQHPELITPLLRYVVEFANHLKVRLTTRARYHTFGVHLCLIKGEYCPIVGLHVVARLGESRPLLTTDSC